MNELVSIVIINWNGQEILKECLDSVEAQNYKDIEVIVLDNNSSDDSLKVLKQYKNIKLIKSDKNLGFAGGNNEAIKYAKGKYILLLNSDTVVTKNFLKVLVKEINRDEKIAAVQPKILFHGSTFYSNNQINSIGSYFTNVGFLYHPGFGKTKTKPSLDKRRKIFSAYGACVLIKKDVIDTLGLFDEDYFAYFEETDFCLRVWLAGHTIYYIPDVYIYHKGGVSARKFGNDKITFHSYKNRIACYLKNLQGITLVKVFPGILFSTELSSIAYLATGRVKLFLAVQKAILWNIKNISITLNKRKKIQKYVRKIKDSTFLPKITINPSLSYYYYLVTGLEHYED